MKERGISAPSEREKAPLNPAEIEVDRGEGGNRKINRCNEGAEVSEEGEIEGGEEDLHGQSKNARDTTEEMNKDEWTIPSRGRQVRISSFFVYNIPDSMAEKDLRMIFNEVETLIDVYIARKRDKYKKRFGFLKIKSNIVFPELLQLLQNKKGNGAILTVSPAKFDRQGKPLKDFERYGRQHESSTKNQHQQRASTVNLNSFRPIFSSFPRIFPNHSQPTPSFKDILLHEPSNTVSRYESHRQINLPPNPYSEYHAWSKTTILITANTIQSMQQFYSSFLSTKPAAAKAIRYVGGLSLLISFSSSKGAEDYYHVHKDIFSRSLKSFALYEDFMQDFGRIIKIKIFGVPLRFWDGEIFDAIAKNFGELMEPSKASINDSNLRYSSALIKIKSSERVNCTATIRWKNIAFVVRVDEEDGEWLPILAGDESNQNEDQSEVRIDNGITVEASTVKDISPAEVSSSTTSSSISSPLAKEYSPASIRSPSAAIDDVMEIDAQSSLPQLSVESGTQQASSVLGSADFLLRGETSNSILSKELLESNKAPVENNSNGVNEISICTFSAIDDFALKANSSADRILSSCINSKNDSSKTQGSEASSNTRKAMEELNNACDIPHTDVPISQAHEFICISQPALEIESRELSNFGNREIIEVEKIPTSNSVTSELNQQVATYFRRDNPPYGNTEGNNKENVDPAVATNAISTLVQQNNSVFREIFQVSKKPNQKSVLPMKLRRIRRNVQPQQSRYEFGYYTDEEDHSYESFLRYQ